jgi:hypothetical protein
MIQLGMADCFQKLSDDLAYLYVFHPTATFSMSMTELESCYAECYGRKLEPAIYAAKTIQKLFTWKQVVKVVQVWCSIISTTTHNTICRPSPSNQTFIG